MTKGDFFFFFISHRDYLNGLRAPDGLGVAAVAVGLFEPWRKYFALSEQSRRKSDSSRELLKQLWLLQLLPLLWLAAAAEGKRMETDLRGWMGRTAEKAPKGLYAGPDHAMDGRPAKYVTNSSKSFDK